jgi:hypothetical protein
MRDRRCFPTILVPDAATHEDATPSCEKAHSTVSLSRIPKGNTGIRRGFSRSAQHVTASVSLSISFSI